MNTNEWLAIENRLGCHAEALGRQINDAVVALYGSHLAPLDFTLVSGALTRCERDLKFFPQVSEILAACTDLELERASQTGRAFPIPEEAWQEAAHLAGRPGPPALCHPASHEAARQMGGLKGVWHEIQYSGAPEHITRGRFIELFKTEVERRRRAVISALYRPDRDPDLFPPWTNPRLPKTEPAWQPALPPGELPKLVAGSSR